MSKIAVIGAGISGVTSAYALAEAGHDVVVIDRHRYPAMETSYANGGQLSASNAEVWNSVATMAKALRWIFRRDAPLLINLAPNWHKYSWLAEFVWNIRHHQENTIATVRLAIDARKHLFAIAEREKISFDLKQCGILHVVYDKEAFDEGRKTSDLLAMGGLERFPVTPLQIREIEPALTGTYYGGFFTPSDATGDTINLRAVSRRPAPKRESLSFKRLPSMRARRLAEDSRSHSPGPDAIAAMPSRHMTMKRLRPTRSSSVPASKADGSRQC